MSPLQTSPWAVTTSRPKQSSRVLPKRTTCVPPALVPKLPPMVQLPSDARLKGKRNPALSQASCRFCKTQPASTVIVRLSASRARIAFMRVKLKTTWVPLASGVDPTTMPVFPPCGTMLTAAFTQALTTWATCSVEFGLTTAKALPRSRLRQSNS